MGELVHKQPSTGHGQMPPNQLHQTGELICEQYALSKCVYDLTQYYTANKRTDDIESLKKTKAGSSNSMQTNEYPDCARESGHR